MADRGLCLKFEMIDKEIFHSQVLITSEPTGKEEGLPEEDKNNSTRIEEELLQEVGFFRQ